MRTIQTLTLLATCGVALLAWPPAAQTRFTTLYNFAGTDPVGLTAAGGKLFVAAFVVAPMGSTCGLISELQPTGGGAWAETTLYTFPNTSGEGCGPTGAPIPGPGGALYGTTTYGGAYDNGTLYELQPPTTPGAAWTETVVYSFNFANGTANPGPPLPGPNGTFYCGANGGTYGYGVLARLKPPSAPGGSWAETVLYNFPGPVGVDPLVPGPGGVFYGTNWGGLIARLNPPAAPGGSWSETVLYTLTRNDGLSPNSVTWRATGRSTAPPSAPITIMEPAKPRFSSSPRPPLPGAVGASRSSRISGRTLT